MVGYFTNQPPLCQTLGIGFRRYMREMGEESYTVCWEKILIEFSEPQDEDVALEYAPWFYERKYLYTFP